MKKVAVTGGVSSGKTTACLLFEELGAFVIDADAVVHHLLSEDFSVRHQVTALFGPSILSSGVIDREKLAQIVFSDSSKLMVLEKLLHPLVIQEINHEYHRVKKEKKIPLFIAEVPLLFEAKLEDQFDAVIVVETPQSIAASRSTLSSDQFAKRNKRLEQSSKRRGNFMISNEGSLSHLKEQVLSIFHQITGV